MTVYYNEIDKYAAQWLRNLITAGHIAPGVVDERSIEDVRPDELAGYEQCHFFAGIAGWPLALRIARLASVPGIWTGSPPCQDNSVAAAIHGGRAGLSGERSGLAHTWLDLIAAGQPQGICFENVPGISPWLAEITSRLGRLGYRVRRPERSSADVGAPHLRRRVWIVADRGGQGFPRPGRPEPPAPFCDPRATPPGDVFITSAGRTRPLDDGLPSRVGAVHAYGNAIDPWAAAEALRSLI
jgi:DNA (cytosine-5)-methyltransferase 1